MNMQNYLHLMMMLQGGKWVSSNSYVYKKQQNCFTISARINAVKIEFAAPNAKPEKLSIFGEKIYFDLAKISFFGF